MLAFHQKNLISNGVIILMYSIETLQEILMRRQDNYLAKGIEFYREYAKMDNLKNSDETHTYTDRFNKGGKQNSKDFEKIPLFKFLSQSTAGGLKDINFNQNRLEVRIQNNNNIILVARYLINQFFGIAKQVDQMIIPVHQHFCKYTRLPSPKTGNCKILSSSTPKITIDDFKNVSTNDTTELHLYKYYKVESKDCVIYYICGYITKNYIMCNTCELCRKELIGSKTYSNKPEATLINLKTKSGLIHPNEFLLKTHFQTNDAPLIYLNNF
ncbi:THAP-type domain-containing protein, partial [Aphis craccivora]